mmetsp:Transcript_4827/g.12209  ORF Transcript_4827/g.12209 Transcript_4827/m.12209 type:complete len:334 (-) Transcript_4827:99-1100(-)
MEWEGRNRPSSDAPPPNRRGARALKGASLLFVTVVCSQWGGAWAAHADAPEDSGRCDFGWQIQRCLECEKIVLDGATRIISTCKLPNLDAINRNVPGKDVYWNPQSASSVLTDDNYDIFTFKAEIRECVINASFAELRYEELMSAVQDLLVGLRSTECTEIANHMCTAMGEGPSSWTTLPSSECCNITSSPTVWTLENKLLWNCECGSGNRDGAEECDDGNLESLDGCNLFCKIDVSQGWFCNPRDGSTLWPERTSSRLGTQPNDARDLEHHRDLRPDTRDLCQCNCDCNLACTCQDTTQRDFCNVIANGEKVTFDPLTGEEINRVACCAALD